MEIVKIDLLQSSREELIPMVHKLRRYPLLLVELTAQLNLSDEICRALAMRQGRLGRLLHLAELLEQMDFGHLDRHLEELQISLDQLLCLQQKAFCWRGDFLKSS